MRKRPLITRLIILSAVFIVGICVFRYLTKDDAPEEEEVVVVEELPESSSLNDVRLDLCDFYYTYYKNADIGGNALINGSYANRTVMAFTVSGIKDTTEYLKTATIYYNDAYKAFDFVGKTYKEDEVLLIAVCDNKIEDIGALVVNLTMTDPETGEDVTFTADINDNGVLETSTAPKYGDVLSTSGGGYWYRDKNSEYEDPVSKNGTDGAYLEYERKLNFISFGEDSYINPEECSVVIESGYNFDYDITFLSNDKEYSDQSTTTQKQIVVTFRCYVSGLTGEIQDQILSDMENAYITYNGNTIYISDSHE